MQRRYSEHLFLMVENDYSNLRYIEIMSFGSFSFQNENRSKLD
jgi:hypothetical protein